MRDHCQKNFVALCKVLLITALLNLPASPAGAESGSFSGTWVVSGKRESMPFGKSREVALFRLSGHVNLKTSIGNESDFWSECIGLTDSGIGSNARCVWRSPDGQEIYIALEGKRLQEGSLVNGIILGGAGKAEGISGDLSFIWTTMTLFNENDLTEVGGYAKDLKGSYQIP